MDTCRARRAGRSAGQTVKGVKAPIIRDGNIIEALVPVDAKGDVLVTVKSFLAVRVKDFIGLNIYVPCEIIICV